MSSAIGSEPHLTRAAWAVGGPHGPSAIKSTRQTIHAAPSTNDLPFPDWAEHEKIRHDAMQRPTYQLEKRITHLVPLGLRQRAKRMLQRAGFRKASGSPWEWPVPWKERR